MRILGETRTAAAARRQTAATGDKTLILATARRRRRRGEGSGRRETGGFGQGSVGPLARCAGVPAPSRLPDRPRRPPRGTGATVIEMENGARGPRLRLPGFGDQAENDEPQPQVVVAFGFLMTNCAPSSPSV